MDHTIRLRKHHELKMAELDEEAKLPETTPAELPSTQASSALGTGKLPAPEAPAQ